MPDTFLTTGVSLGLLAGIVSGVCYVVANGLTWPRPEQRSKRCSSLTSGRGDGVCRECGGDTRGGIVPCICNHHEPVKFESGAWFLRQVQRGLSLMPWSISTDKLEQIEEECEGGESSGSNESHRELRSVREFLEALSAKLAGGALEGTRVSPLYDHPAYIPPRSSSPSIASSAHGHPSSGASGAHAQLKRLVARVVEEAAALPALARYAAEPTAPSIDSSTYEDLLATAILNKVIERYQTENGSGGRSSGIHSASASPTPSERSSPRSLNSRARDITPPLREEDEELSDWEEGEVTASDEALELPRRVPFPEFGGDIVHNRNNDERDFDEVSGSDIQAVDGSWEENWLFQKKKIKSLQSVPVPMLVPNSNTEYRALIGDRDADDTTDLSDNASDGDEEAEYKSDIKRVLDSKHVIGGKPKIDEILDFEPDSLNTIETGNEFENDLEQNKNVVNAVNNDINDIKQLTTEINEAINNDIANLNNEKQDSESKDSILVLGIDSGPVPKAEFSVKEEIHRSLLNGSAEDYASRLDAKINGEAKDEIDGFNKGSISTLSRHEREGEYEETVDKPVQRYADSLRRQHFEEPQHIPTRDTDREDDLIPGSIAYRERKKWLNYVEMPNNPYSPEAIQKRLSTKSTSSLFDMLTSKTIDMDDNRSVKSEIIEKQSLKEHEIPEKEQNNNNPSHLTINTVDANMNGNRSKSPSPRILKDVLAEEVPQYKRFGRDYYIKEAKISSGGRRKRDEYSETSSLSSMNKSTSLDNFDAEFTSPGLLIKQFNTIASNQGYKKFIPNETQTHQTKESITTFPNNKTEILIEYEDVTEQNLFNAKPVYVDDDTDKKFEEILQSVPNVKTDENEPKSPVSPTLDTSYVSSSSLEDSIKIYNVQTGEIVKCKPDNVSERYEGDGSDIESKDKEILEVANDTSEHSDVSEESFEIVDKDSVSEERFDDISELEDLVPQLPSVKELAKKFVSMENLTEPVKPQAPMRRQKSKENLFDPKSDRGKQSYCFSLTARSISKEFREELKLSMATPLTVPGGSKEIPNGEEVIKESSRPGSPLPEPGTIKSKLAFFESLKNRFNSK